MLFPAGVLDWRGISLELLEPLAISAFTGESLWEKEASVQEARKNGETAS